MFGRGLVCAPQASVREIPLPKVQRLCPETASESAIDVRRAKAAQAKDIMRALALLFREMAEKSKIAGCSNAASFPCALPISPAAIDQYAQGQSQGRGTRRLKNKIVFLCDSTS